jgi:hypothetical protein
VSSGEPSHRLGTDQVSCDLCSYENFTPQMGCVPSGASHNLSEPEEVKGWGNLSALGFRNSKPS